MFISSHRPDAMGRTTVDQKDTFGRTTRHTDVAARQNRLNACPSPDLGLVGEPTLACVTLRSLSCGVVF
jgi:hypothetical protein